jgi:hypothetical protein
MIALYWIYVFVLLVFHIGYFVHAYITPQIRRKDDAYFFTSVLGVFIFVPFLYPAVLFFIYIYNKGKKRYEKNSNH